jgi:2-(1,2-epoxy-1,2-dihydrophenyl)acetyl-CoA isomerase
MAYTSVGLAMDGASSYFLPRLIGLRRTQELLLTNRKLSAAEALEWGLITRVVPDGDLMTEATKLGRQLAAGPTACHGACKRLLAQTFGNGIETQSQLETRGIAATARGPDGREGLAAFGEKRKPKFTGR